MSPPPLLWLSSSDWGLWSRESGAPHFQRHGDWRLCSPPRSAALRLTVSMLYVIHTIFTMMQGCSLWPSVRYCVRFGLILTIYNTLPIKLAPFWLLFTIGSAPVFPYCNFKALLCSSWLPSLWTKKVMKFCLHIEIENVESSQKWTWTVECLIFIHSLTFNSINKHGKYSNS